MADVHHVDEVAEQHTTMLACTRGCDEAGIRKQGAWQSSRSLREVQGCERSGHFHVCSFKCTSVAAVHPCAEEAEHHTTIIGLHGV